MPAKKKSRLSSGNDLGASTGDDGDGSEELQDDISIGGSETRLAQSPGISEHTNVVVPMNRLQRIITGIASKAAQQKPSSTSTKSSTRKSRNTGKLSLMMEFPVDIFNEIAYYLRPLDLVYLSRTSRALRKLLMSKSSRQVWRTVLNSVDLPECPPDLSEPQYACLVFEQCCQGCGAPRVLKANFIFRVRLCKGCAGLNIFSGQELALSFDGHLDGTDIFALVPYGLAAEWYDPDMHWSILINQQFFAPDFHDVADIFLSLEPDSEEMRHFRTERIEIVCEISDFANMMNDWIDSQADKRRCEAAEIRDRRFTSIIEKLKGLGYNDEDMISSDDDPDWKWDKLVDQPRELTDRIWKNIQPQLEETIRLRREYMAAMLFDDRTEDLRSIIMDTFDASDERHKFMNFGELLELPEVYALIDESERREPITLERWLPVLDEIRGHIEQYALQFEKQCISVLAHKTLCTENVGGPEGHDFPLLYRATSFFRPSELNISTSSIGLYRYVDLALVDACSLDVWILDEWESDPIIAKIAVALLQSLGIAEDVDMAHMWSLGACFECKTCHPTLRNTSLSWQELVSHFYDEYIWYNDRQQIKDRDNLDIPLINDHDVSSTSDQLATLTKGNQAEIPVDQAEIPVEIGAWPWYRVSCELCEALGKTHSTFGEIRADAHKRAKHGIAT